MSNIRHLELIINLRYGEMLETKTGDMGALSRNDQLRSLISWPKRMWFIVYTNAGAGHSIRKLYQLQ
jgi:hypothetical protein